MESYEFEHSNPMRMAATDPSQYLRVGANESWNQLSGVPMTYPEFRLAQGLAPMRSNIEKEFKSQFNPVLAPMLKGAPAEVKEIVKKIMETEIGSEMHQALMLDPVAQKFLGTSAGQAYQQSLRTLSMGGSIAATGVAGSPAEMAAQRLDLASRFNKAMLDRIYSDPKNRDGNMAFTGGVSAGDTLALGGYLSKFGGSMSSALLRDKKGNLLSADETSAVKAEYVGARTRDMAEFMKIIGSTEMQDALEQFRRLEGMEFGKVNPARIKMKLKHISELAANTGIAGKEVYEMLTFGEGMMGAATGRTNEASRAGNEGYILSATARGLGMASALGITDDESRYEIVKAQQKKAVRMMGTTAGRSADLLSKLYGAGRLDRETYDRLMEQMRSGGKFDAATMKEVYRKTGFDVNKIIHDDLSFQEETTLLDKEITARHGAGAEQLKKQLGGEVEVSLNKKYEADYRRIETESRASMARKYVNSMKKDYGVQLSKAERKDIDMASMNAMMKQIDEMGLKPEDAENMKAIIGMGMEQGMSASRVLSRLRNEGPIGREVAAGLEVARAKSEYRKVVEASGKSAPKDVLDEASNLLKDMGVKGIGGKNMEERDTNIRKALEVQAKHGDKWTARMASKMLEKMNKAKQLDKELIIKGDAAEIAQKSGTTETEREQETMNMSLEDREEAGRKAYEGPTEKKATPSLDTAAEKTKDSTKEQANKDRENGGDKTGDNKPITVSGSVKIINNSEAYIELQEMPR